MSKASGFATMLAVVLSWIAVSCSGPVFFKPPMASVASTTTAPAQGAVATAKPGQPAIVAPASNAALANAPIAAPAVATPAAPPAGVAVVSPWNGAGVFAICALGVFVTLALSSLFLRGRSHDHA
ncbi:MAG TPA: hypothetical protein VG326_00330 [Tepidisphaeraceae bacterium]|nr:hypothetical protein [Tepidisphaeraceae bacterium]